ncbi:hypothetical protein GCM10023193_54730 [Planotetraspora kaengkrachanensis]|uniref:Uncharacterized protein n=1 Tax=Planotetraspora kaengkrachanensis TaxID=575193 RepID=A0A8J3PUI4_9ACTN|nr:hypothetical protein Pka01_43580 [Planotetraspora kaengkrachanensis]
MGRTTWTVRTAWTAWTVRAGWIAWTAWTGVGGTVIGSTGADGREPIGVGGILRTGDAGGVPHSPPGRTPPAPLEPVPYAGRVPRHVGPDAPGRAADGRRARRRAAGRLRRSSGHDLLGGTASRRSAGSEMAGARFTPDKTGSMTLSMNAC